MATNTEQKGKKTHLTGGFGLIELLVSVSVMVLVTSVILARHDSFNGATLLRGQAYKVALQIKEMQMLAISSTESGTGFRNVYGLHFTTVAPDSYGIFRDADNDYFFDAASEEFGKQGILDKRFVVDAVRLIGSAVVPTELSITFERPNFDAKLYTGSGVAVASTVSGVEIDLRVKGTTGTGPGKVRTIEITKAGQITVKDI